MRLTERGWIVIYILSFLFGVLFPWEILPWN
jgi:hypothetical protein